MRYKKSSSKQPLKRALVREHVVGKRAAVATHLDAEIAYPKCTLVPGFPVNNMGLIECRGPCHTSASF